jgi:hypothetical protein
MLSWLKVVLQSLLIKLPEFLISRVFSKGFLQTRALSNYIQIVDCLIGVPPGCVREHCSALMLL